ncbi:hypothetical protein JHK82_033749 [Glycine max]|nr:hypothetical protein JHK82_033749 [Glycine max]
MGIVDNFPGYAQKHIGRKVKKEEPQSAGEQQLEQVQPQFVDPEFGHHLSKLRGSKLNFELEEPERLQLVVEHVTKVFSTNSTACEEELAVALVLNGLGIMWIISDGRKMRFWLDKWLSPGVVLSSVLVVPISQVTINVTVLDLSDGMGRGHEVTELLGEAEGTYGVLEELSELGGFGGDGVVRVEERRWWTEDWSKDSVNLRMDYTLTLLFLIK